MARKLLGKVQPQHAIPEGTGLGPVYSRKSRWMISDGTDYKPKMWSPSFADNYSPRHPGDDWETVSEDQSEQIHYYSNPFPNVPWKQWPRYSGNSRVASYPEEVQAGEEGIPQQQYNADRAPDARWSAIPETNNPSATAYATRKWQDVGYQSMNASVDSVPRLPHRTPQEYSFLRRFDVMMGRREHDGRHFSMADHKRLNQPIYGMKARPSARNTYRLAPSPLDVFTVDFPNAGPDQAPPQNSYTSPQPSRGDFHTGNFRLG